MKIKKTPAIRFREFEDEWEQRNLGNECEVITGGTPNTHIEDYWSPKEVPWLSSGEVNKKRIEETEDMISQIGLKNSSAKWVKENSVIIALAGQGKTRGTVAINYIPLTTNQSLAAISPNKLLLSEFLFQNLEGRYDEIRGMSTAAGSRGGLNKQIIIDIPIPYTNIQEQLKIGDFLRNLDKFITLQQQKYDKFKTIKKAMLEKMFPKDGSNVPEIRFTGFTDSWEQCKLGECFDERQERSGDGDLISITINYGIKKFNELGRHDNSSEDKSNYKRVDVGDIAYNSMRMWQGASGYSPYRGILSPAYTVIIPKEGVDSLFFSYVFKRPQMIHIFKLRSQGITSDTWNLKFPAFSEIETMLPSLSEQRSIGKYFINLDRVITLQKYKIERLKNIKQAMLEKMFV